MLSSLSKLCRGSLGLVILLTRRMAELPLRAAPAVWEYTLCGYQVIKKWLSYREREVLGRDLTTDEANYVTEMVRRIAAILALGAVLDENHTRIKSDTWPWPTKH